MIEINADIAIIGAGFSGSLIALLLKQIGLKPVLIDRGTHPRFAIGESSTPLANLILEDLARRYELPRLAPLANYAQWKQTYPDIVCGLKRGFSYFHHTLGEDFRPRADRANELLVAASASNDDADTHWLRSDFDMFLAHEVSAAGIPYFDGTSIDELLPRGDGWELKGHRCESGENLLVPSPPSWGEMARVRGPNVDDVSTRKDVASSAVQPSIFKLQPSECPPHPNPIPPKAEGEGTRIRITVDFLIDASGEGSFVAKQLGIEPHRDGLKTRSRALFSHFTGVLPWTDLYSARGGDISGHPYPCDDAALHHVFDGGWMWVLRFDNGVTSAGFSLDPDRFPLDKTVAPEAEWTALMQQLPAVAEQFARAKPIVPWRQTGRMQRRLERSAGSNWVMLPNTAMFLDPLHSTGNAFTLVGIERLMLILERSWGQAELTDELKQYDSLVQTEIEFLDSIVSGSFAGFRDFRRMVALSMFYFAAATWSEEERRAGMARRGAAFLSADHAGLKVALAQAIRDIGDESVSAPDFASRIRAAIAPFNRIGFCDERRQNMYPYDS